MCTAQLTLLLLRPSDVERSLFRGKGYAANAKRIKTEARQRSGKTFSHLMSAQYTIECCAMYYTHDRSGCNAHQPAAPTMEKMTRASPRAAQVILILISRNFIFSH